MVEKIKSWDRCKIHETAGEAAAGEGEGLALVLIKMV